VLEISREWSSGALHCVFFLPSFLNPYCNNNKVLDEVCELLLLLLLLLLFISRGNNVKS